MSSAPPDPTDQAFAPATLAASRRVIARHSALAGTGVLIPFFLVDRVAVTAVQLQMLRELALLHGRPHNEKELSTVLASISGGVLSFFIGRTGPAMAWKAAALAVPVIGPFLRFGTGPALMAGYTWVLGETFRRHYIAGGYTHNFTVKRFRELAYDLVPAGFLGG